MQLLLVPLLFAAACSAAIQTCSPAACTPRDVTTDFTFVIDVSNGLGGQANFQLVQNFLFNFTGSLTLSTLDSQVAIYTYATQATTYSSLNSGNDWSKLQTAINSIKYDNTGDRNLYAALTKEESEVTAATGFRSGYKHVLVVISSDSWTGTFVLGSPLLTAVQKKYDLVMAIGLGTNSVKNQNVALAQFTGNPSYVFFSVNYDQLPYAGQWLYNYACPGTHMTTPIPATTPMPTQSPQVSCQLSTLNYDIYLIVDTSTAISAADFAALKNTLISFVNPLTIGDGKTQIQIVATSVDVENYYTAFHAGQTRNNVLSVINKITQDGSTGQTLKLALQAIQATGLSKNYNTANKLIVYFTGTTSFDTDPNAQMQALKQAYGAEAVAVQWESSASSSALSAFTGGSNCVDAATTSSQRSGVAVWLQNKLCGKSFCL